MKGCRSRITVQSFRRLRRLSVRRRGFEQVSRFGRNDNVALDQVADAHFKQVLIWADLFRILKN